MDDPCLEESHRLVIVQVESRLCVQVLNRQLHQNHARVNSAEQIQHVQNHHQSVQFLVLT